MTAGRDYFVNNFTGGRGYNDLKNHINPSPNMSPRSTRYVTKNNLKDIAKQVKKYCKDNNIKFNKLSSSGQSSSSARNSGNINITISENRGLSFWDYLLLSNIFSGRQQPIIINDAPGAATYNARSAQKKEDSKDTEQTNKLLFIIALCVITHLVVCAIYHLYFKKEAEKLDKPIDYLANRQFGIAVFQFAFGATSLIIAGTSLSQSSIFFPFLINTFICLGSSLLFYHEHNEEIENEVKPYMKLAELLINDRELPPSYAESQYTTPSAPSPDSYFAHLQTPQQHYFGELPPRT